MHTGEMFHFFQHDIVFVVILNEVKDLADIHAIP